VLLFAVGQLGSNAVTLDTWMDEGKYLTNGYWYFTGKIAPYSTVDPSFYMPLSFYSVAPMEWLFGVGYLPGRVLMIVFALGCLVLAYLTGYLTGARTGRSRLAGVSAVVLIVAYPVTLTYFATATPYAMVSCPFAGARFCASRRMVAGAGIRHVSIILWALVFTRPDILPIAMIPTGWALLIEPWRKIECLAVAFLTFMVASVVTVWAFGPGLPGCSGYPGTCAVSSGHRHTTRTDLQRSASYRLAARSCVTLWRYSNLFQPLFFSTLFGCLDHQAGHDRASHFFCLAREQPATTKAN